jgi:phenylacetaldehyde dehydrogenase
MNQLTTPPISQEVADFPNQQHCPFVGGEFLRRSNVADLPVIDPSTGKVLTNVVDSGSEVVDEAVRRARTALSGPWARMSPRARERLILQLADEVENDGAVLAELESLESGKAVAMARALSVGGAVDWLRYYAGWATKIEGSSFSTSIAVPPGSDHFAVRCGLH